MLAKPRRTPDRWMRFASPAIALVKNACGRGAAKRMRGEFGIGAPGSEIVAVEISRDRLHLRGRPAGSSKALFPRRGAFCGKRLDQFLAHRAVAKAGEERFGRIRQLRH